MASLLDGRFQPPRQVPEATPTPAPPVHPNDRQTPILLESVETPQTRTRNQQRPRHKHNTKANPTTITNIHEVLNEKLCAPIERVQQSFGAQTYLHLLLPRSQEFARGWYKSFCRMTVAAHRNCCTLPRASKLIISVIMSRFIVALLLVPWFGRHFATPLHATGEDEEVAVNAVFFSVRETRPLLWRLHFLPSRMGCNS